MKNKAFLSLIEQICAVLIFAVAAAICLKGFAVANNISATQEAKDNAVTVAQNTAEMIKYTKGDLEQTAELLLGECDGSFLYIHYDQQWKPSESAADAQYILKAEYTDDSDPLLGTALISVTQEDETLFELTVCWQEDESK